MKRQKRITKYLGKGDKSSIVYRMWKHHRRAVAASTAASLIAMGGAGVGIGYVVWHNKNSNPDPIPSSTVNIYGNSSAQGQSGIVGSVKFNAVTNTGRDITIGADWSIQGTDNQYFNISDGVLSWGVDVPDNNYQLSIGCTYQTFVAKSVDLSVDITAEPIPIGGTYIKFSAVSEYFNCDSSTKTLSGFKTDQDPIFNQWMLGHGYNGIDFFDDIATINSTFADSVSTGINGSMQFLKFNHIADLGEEAQAFQNCVSLKQVYLGHGSISDNRILLPAHCFDGCKNLYYFGLANDARITSIGLEAFSQCASFTNREMFHVSQDNLGNIGTWVDSSDGKGSWIMKPDGSGCLACIAFGEIEIDQLSSFGDSAFGNCASIKTVKSWNVNSSLTSISSNAFYQCKNLVNIEVPSFVTSIGNSAFSSSGLTSLSFDSTTTAASSLTAIGNHAFDGCTNLKNISVPSTVTSIGEQTFGSCSNLKSFEFYKYAQGTVANLSIGVNAFLNCISLQLIQLVDKTGTLSCDTNAFSGAAIDGTIRADGSYDGSMAANLITNYLPGTGQQVWFFHTNSYSAT